MTSHPEIFDGVRLHKGQSVAVIRHNARASQERSTRALCRMTATDWPLCRRTPSKISGWEVTSHYEVTTHPEIFDGVRLHKGQSVAVIRHNARVLLSCERVILNFLQRMSGIATLTRKFVEAVSGTKARILDTRKTAPGLRVIDKYAVRCGGGQNHRLDLSDGVLIKNNHIALAGGIVPALERAVRNRRGSQPIEVEVRTLEELEEALAHGAEAILLDNMSPEDVRRAVERCAALERRIPLECSGGIRLENVRAYAETGVDFISVGLLTHSPQAVDMSMRVSPA